MMPESCYKMLQQRKRQIKQMWQISITTTESECRHLGGGISLYSLFFYVFDSFHNKILKIFIFVPDYRRKKTKNFINRLTHNQLIIRSFCQTETCLYNNGVNTINEIFKTNF